MKVGANVPVYVLEYLLGKYCSSTDERVVQEGLEYVKSTIVERFVRADESEKIKALIRQRGTFKVIDKVRARLLESEDKYWAELLNLGQSRVHIPEHFINRYDRILAGGFWATLEVEYRADPDEPGSKHPFHIRDIKPIQLASFKMEEYIETRRQFTTEEWIDLMLRSTGLEPCHFTKRVKLLFLIRLIPIVERNFNLIELGPRGTGKSFVYREVSPNAILVSGGKTTVANLFYNMATKKLGLIGLWDVVAFDEVAGIQFDDKTAIQILKDYMESASFSRGREEHPADASMVFLGNLNQSVEVLAKSHHLFQPLPEAMQDMALIDRFHFYLPGWELPKMETVFFTNHYGLVVDYLAEAFRELRKRSYSDTLDRHFSLGSHLNARDAKAVRKAVSGIVKLLHPDGGCAKEEVEDYLSFALEGRRRVKEQLKKMGSFEYYHTSFSYLDKDTMQEHFVGVPEEGGKNLIAADPLPIGSTYTAALTSSNRVILYRIEVTKMGGTGKLVVTGNPDKGVRDSLKTAFDYLKARKRELGAERDVEAYDFHVQAVDLLASREGSPVGVAFFVVLFSILKEKPVLPALVVLGDMTIQGNIHALPSLVEPLRIAMDNGAKKVLIPLENKKHFLEVPGDVVEKVDPIFYSDPLTAALKALGIN